MRKSCLEFDMFSPLTTADAVHTAVQALSYRQLAFVGDAALWMLFAEHAFHKFGDTEDPIRCVTCTAAPDCRGVYLAPATPAAASAAPLPAKPAAVVARGKNNLCTRRGQLVGQQVECDSLTAKEA